MYRNPLESQDRTRAWMNVVSGGITDDWSEGKENTGRRQLIGSGLWLRSWWWLMTSISFKTNQFTYTQSQKFDSFIYYLPLPPFGHLCTRWKLKNENLNFHIHSQISQIYLIFWAEILMKFYSRNLLTNSIKDQLCPYYLLIHDPRVSFLCLSFNSFTFVISLCWINSRFCENEWNWHPISSENGHLIAWIR